MGPSVLLYDCEILKAIPDQRYPRQEGVEYCGGWTDYKAMGISVIGVYDYREDQYRTFCADNFEEFRILANSVDSVVGFNNGGFDDLLLQAVLGWTIPTGRSHDLLSEVWVASGLGRRFAGKQYAGYGLDALAKANGLPGKTSRGDHAPILWQRGKVGTVIDYCLNDVWLTKRLVDLCVARNYLTSPVTGSPITITSFSKVFNGVKVDRPSVLTPVPK